MAEQKASKSRYALKLRGVIQPTFIPRAIRRCAKCKLRLPGRKGHGYVTPRGVLCGECVPWARRRA